MIKSFLSAVALSAFVAIPAANAASVTLDQQDPNSVFGAPSEAWSANITLKVNGAQQQARAGLLRLTDNYGSYVPAWCVDVFTTLSVPSAYETGALPFTTAVIDNVNRLFNGFYADVDTSDEAAGFQFALWEIVHDAGSHDLTSGVVEIVSSTGNAIAQANTYLSALSSQSDNDYGLTFYESVGGNSQDLISTVSPVPVPAALILLASGLAGLGAMRRRP